MPREIIKPIVGQPPVLITLDEDEPTQVEGKFGVEYQYTLNNNEAIMWLRKEGKAAIDATGARAGDSLAIQKIKRGKSDIWLTEKVQEEPPPPADHRSSRTPAWVTEPEPPSTEYQMPKAKQPAAPAASPEPKPAARPGAQLLAAALYAAIDAANAAEAYARDKGRAIAFGVEDIRAMAATLYIDARKESR